MLLVSSSDAIIPELCYFGLKARKPSDYGDGILFSITGRFKSDLPYGLHAAEEAHDDSVVPMRCSLNSKRFLFFENA